MEYSKTSRRGFLKAAAAAGAGAAAGCATAAAGTARPPRRGSAAPGASKPRTNISVPRHDAPPADQAPPLPTDPGAEDSTQIAEQPAVARPPMEEGAIIRCAMVGVGGRGSALLQSLLEREDVAVVAVADAYDVWRDRALNWCARRGTTNDYIEYEEMLSKEEVDVVFVAAPDHIHAPAAMAVLEAGADLYIEAPIALDWQDAVALRRLARSTGAIVQMGNQFRSGPMYRHARDIIKEGDIGQLVAVEIQRYFADQPLSAFQPPREASEKNVHWKAFLADTEPVPFDLVRFFQWRRFREYSHGSMGAFAPHIDLAHFIAGCGMPLQVMSIGGAGLFNDGRTCPDTFGVLAAYAEGFQVNYFATPAASRVGTVERYLGAHGSIEIFNSEKMVIIRKDAREDWSPAPVSGEPHLDNFLACVRSRNAPEAPMDAGCMEAVCSAMAAMSRQTGTGVRWDAASGSVIGA